MAKQGIVDIALASINTQIAELERAKEIILAARQQTPTTEPKVKRPRKTRKGLPATDASGNV